MEFTDHEEAKQALYLTMDFIFHSQPVRCYKLLPKDVARANNSPTSSVSNHIGEYIVSIVDMTGRGSRVTGFDILQACEDCGKVKAFRIFRPLMGAFMSFRVEWSDTRTNVNQLSMALLSVCRFAFLAFLHTDKLRAIASLSHHMPLILCDPLWLVDQLLFLAQLLTVTSTFEMSWLSYIQDHQTALTTATTPMLLTSSRSCLVKTFALL